MFTQISGKFTAYQTVLLFLGGWLTLLSQSTPVQAQIPNNGVILAQARVWGAVPPPPNLSPIPQSPQPIVIPQVQQTQPLQWSSSPQNIPGYQSVQSNSYNQNSELYLVYVDNNYQQLQRVKQIEPTAYVRQYNGRSIIQSGSFSKQSNAERRVRELEFNGIRGAQVVRAGSGQQVMYPNSTAYYDPRPNNQPRENPRAYYVTIPAKSEQLSAIANQIRQNTNRYDIVLERQQPRGPHVAVGPFTQRSDAEQWNSYLRKQGFGNARVYYGR
ncbi:SPOR domain-containing protein [Calothrix sp. PCC 7507]|uniref:SPOR domain-containing protein n=1 Tax=Calothrix sp. PCC 7507 TaxID=99598 RepID=UPI00029ED0D6|nr:hypothetical protein [Calothrix sp. PCC 7507]AFY33565.1 hypothetical protein Cal7507_3157 [Calothrix sp. PCC 7507]